MTPSPTLLPTLLDLWLSLLKLLGRPAVQVQLLAGLAALVVAWLLARAVTRAMRRRYDTQAATIRDQVEADAKQHLAGTDDPDEDDPYFLLLTNREMLADAVNRRMGLRRRIHLLGLQIVLPVLVVALLVAAYLLFVAAGLYSGLLLDLAFLAGVFMVYRLAMGLAYMVGNESAVTYYRTRLFGPVVAVAMSLLALDAVVNLDTLAGATIVPLEDNWLTLGGVFLATFGFYIWVMVISLIKALILALAGRDQQANRGSLDAILTLAQYGLIAIGLFAVFHVLQLNTATIAAITGGLAIGVGLALQDVLKNFLGGIIVLFEGSVRPGDWVEIAGTEGEIDKLSIRSTTVRTLDDVEYIVPNQDWFSGTVKTFTRTNRFVRARVPVGVSGGAEPRLVQQILVETARRHPDVMLEPPPAAPLLEFKAATMSFVLLAWVGDARIKDRVIAELRLLVWDALQAQGIKLA
ncbi:MAG: mechanosensitive ion channel [Caldilineales bacterium]